MDASPATLLNSAPITPANLPRFSEPAACLICSDPTPSSASLAVAEFTRPSAFDAYCGSSVAKAGQRDDDPQRQTQQDRIDQQDHHQGGRPARPAVAGQPALHRRHRDHHDQRHERGADQPRGGLNAGDDHHRRGRTDEDHQGAWQSAASRARAVRERRRHRPDDAGFGNRCGHAATVRRVTTGDTTRDGRMDGHRRRVRAHDHSRRAYTVGKHGRGNLARRG